MTTGNELADQVRRLLEALRPPAGSEDPAGADDAAEHPAGECRWCPHCQVLAVLRGDRPEVTAALNDVLTTAIAALRQFAGETPASPPPEADEAEGTHRDPAPVVQRIELG